MSSFMPWMNGSESNSTMEWYDPFEDPTVRGLFIVSYGMVFICCILGNLLVIVVVLKNRKMRTETNFFLTNLAVADLCVGIFCVIPRLGRYLWTYWMFGHVMCRLVYFMEMLTYTASVTLLTVISGERYLVIIHPMKTRHLVTKKRLKIIVLVVWIASALYSVPQLLMYSVTSLNIDPISNTTVEMCYLSADYGRKMNAKLYHTTHFCLTYFIPLVLMTIMYTRISVVLFKSSVLRRHSKTPRRRHRSWNTMRSSTEEQSECTNIDVISCPESPISEESTIVPASIQQLFVSTSSTKNNKPLSSDQIHLSNHDRQSFCAASNPASRNHYYKKSLKQGSLYNPAMELSEARHNGDLRGRVVDSPVTQRRKVMRMLIVVVVAFTLCVLPYQLRVLLDDWKVPYHILYPPISFLLLYLNSAINPFLYAILSDNFRHYIRETFNCKCRRFT